MADNPIIQVDTPRLIDFLKQDLAQLENQRKSVLRKQKAVLYWIAGATLPGAVIVGLISQSLLGALGGAFAAALVVGLLYYLIVVSTAAGKYQRSYKYHIGQAIVRQIDPNLQFNPSDGISCSDFERSELYTQRPDRYGSGDLIQGSLGKTAVRIANVHAESEHRDTDDEGRTSTRYTDIFRGNLFVADFHKQFNGRTFIFLDSAERTFGSVGRFFQSMGGRSGTRLTQMDDPDFEQVFAIYTDNEIECRYILSHSMMQSLLDLNERIASNDLRIGFSRSNIWITISHSKRTMQPSISVPANDERQMQQFVLQITQYLSIVNELNLNTRIWSKQ
ncbi:MAG: DUF3137 domain-containing protein [Planctomycetota bacterium]